MRETLSYRGGYDFDWLQNGVVGAGDLLASAVTLSSTSTGALTLTLAAGSAWVKDASGALLRLSRAADAGRVLTPGSLPATTKYAVVGVELDATGALSMVKGADTATQLNTAALIAANTPAVTAGRLRLADFAYWNNAGTINLGDHTTAGTQGTNWIDRRPWARGAYDRVVRTSNASGGSDYTYATNVYALIDGANLAIRMECSGLPVRLTLRGMFIHTTGGDAIWLLWNMDGFSVEGDGVGTLWTVPVNNAQTPVLFTKTLVPAAGSHLFQPWWQTNGATATLYARANIPVQFEVEELVRQNASNGTV